MRHPAALALLALALLVAAWHSAGIPQATAPSADAARERLLAPGKKLFLARCASCHNERGDKAHSSGLPLDERKLMQEVIARNVNGRFRPATGEDRRAVALYIQRFIKSKS